jgi:hypothetical protein
VEVAMYERLAEEIPKALVEKYDLNSHLRDSGDFEELK